MPAESQPPRENESRTVERPTLAASSNEPNTHTLTVEITSRSPSYTSDSSANLSPLHPTFSTHRTALVLPPPTASVSPPFRPRSKTLASLTSLARTGSQEEMTPQEIHLPRNPTIDGRLLEAVLYRDASECPICFLLYPPYLNRTRCCDQLICSECFVQIKRPDPHPPEHADPTSTLPGLDAGDGRETGESLVSEPAACPFCVQPEFGVTYDPPPFRTGLAYATHPPIHALAHAASAMSSSSSLSSTFSGPVGASRRRTTSLSATSPTVITTDRIRPDWSQKLANARAQAARRSAAATALHTAAYLMGGFSSANDGRSFPGFGRRNRLGRGTRIEITAGGGMSPHGRPGADAEAVDPSARDAHRDDLSSDPDSAVDGRRGLGEHGDRSGRRTRLEELEEMMMMEAIRLSLASEEEAERKRKGEEEEDQQQQRQAQEKQEWARTLRENSMGETPLTLSPNLPGPAAVEPDVCSGNGPARSDSGSFTRETSVGKG